LQQVFQAIENRKNNNQSGCYKCNSAHRKNRNNIDEVRLPFGKQVSPGDKVGEIQMLWLTLFRIAFTRRRNMKIFQQIIHSLCVFFKVI
jgi:hypothetical protein